MNPYIVFFTIHEHGKVTFKPVFDLLIQSGYDATICFRGKPVWGNKGGGFKLAHYEIAKKPSAVVVFRSWWSPDREVCQAAKKLNIPVIMINHGAMMVFKNSQKYKKSIKPADVNCLWNQHDYEIWRQWGNKDRLEITGNPLYDQLYNYQCPKIETPDKFALVLTQRTFRKILNPSAEQISKIIPVVAKTHPLDDTKNYYKERYLTYEKSWTLLPLLYKCSLVLTNVSSALLPAIYWRKPIFIHNFPIKGFHFQEFKEKYEHIFNFKSGPKWNKELIENAKIPEREEDIIRFCYIDGQNSKRIKEVIDGYIP